MLVLRRIAWDLKMKRKGLMMCGCIVLTTYFLLAPIVSSCFPLGATSVPLLCD